MAVEHPIVDSTARPPCAVDVDFEANCTALPPQPAYNNVSSRFADGKGWDDSVLNASSSEEEGDDEAAELRRRKEPDTDGKYHDDPLWYGKTLNEIRYATELEKANGDAAGRERDWKRAGRYWKNALKGAEKLQDTEVELRLHLNLAMGYTRQGKLPKALDHCETSFEQRLMSTAPSSLRAKAHFRRADAYAEAGETSKAMTSLRACLQANREASGTTW